MKLFKILLTLFILGVIVLAGIYFLVYNKPHTDYEKATPSFTIEASELYQAFTATQSEAEDQYNGAVIQFTGTLDSVESSGGLNIAVVAFEDGMFGKEGIRCTMLENHTDKATSLVGQTATLKGFLTGYSGSDVILEYCSVIQ